MAPRLDELLFDSSAVVKYYHPEAGTEAVRFWINELRTVRAQQVRLFLPNICVPEVLGVFYAWCYLKRRLTPELLKYLRATFLADLEQGKLAVCALTRHDVIATEPLYDLAHEEYARRQHLQEGLLSPIDVMVIAMAHRVQQRHPKLFLVTADQQMGRVAARIGLGVLNPTDEETMPRYLKPPVAWRG
jgi:hypothetical protein